MTAVREAHLIVPRQEVVAAGQARSYRPEQPRGRIRLRDEHRDDRKCGHHHRRDERAPRRGPDLERLAEDHLVRNRDRLTARERGLAGPDAVGDQRERPPHQPTPLLQPHAHVPSLTRFRRVVQGHPRWSHVAYAAEETR